MQYHISYQKPHQHFIDITIQVDNLPATQEYIELQLPAWRPGRYELQHFAKNIRQFQVVAATTQQPLKFEKITKDRWKIHKTSHTSLAITYQYYAIQLDAGGTYLDEDFLYINPVNCCMYIEGLQNTTHQLHVQVPYNYDVASGLQQLPSIQDAQTTTKTIVLEAQSFYHIGAAPMVLSPNLQHYTYTIEHLPTTFHIWIEGKWQPNVPQLIVDFQKFTLEQINIFAANNPKHYQEAFPETNYHFIFIIPPFAYYHGVEHFNSTVLVLGVPQGKDFQALMYQEVLAISSHELFHFWNICRIRPQELLPYNYTQENYFRTGFVAEGITTYYGDYLLARSGVFDTTTYLQELNLLINRYKENFGRFNYSLSESSFDLWLDGYTAGIPHRKVSIYNEGALAALILDLYIRKLSNDKHSLDHLMQELWYLAQQKQGYTIATIQEKAEMLAGVNLDTFFQECIYGKAQLDTWVQKLAIHAGLELATIPNNRLMERYFGIRYQLKDHKNIITLITPNSQADNYFALNDELISIDNHEVDFADNYLATLSAQNKVIIQYLRKNKLRIAELTLDTNNNYLPYHQFLIKDTQRYTQWLTFK